MSNFETPLRWRNVDRLNTVFVASDYSVKADDYLIVASTALGNVTVTLPPASAMIGMEFVVKKAGVENAVTIVTSGGEFIDFQPSAELVQDRDALRFLSSTDGQNWYVTAYGESQSEALVVTGLPSYSVTEADDIIVCNPVGDATVTLPAAGLTEAGRSWVVKNEATAGGVITVQQAGQGLFDFGEATDILGQVHQAVRYASLGSILGYVRIASYSDELLTLTLAGAELQGNNQTSIELFHHGVPVANGYLNIPYDCHLRSFSLVTVHNTTGGGPFGDWSFDWTIYDGAGSVVTSASIPCSMASTQPSVNFTVVELAEGTFLNAEENHLGATFTGPALRNCGCTASLVLARV